MNISCAWIHSLVRSFVRSFVRSLVRSFVRSIVRWGGRFYLVPLSWWSKFTRGCVIHVSENRYRPSLTHSHWLHVVGCLDGHTEEPTIEPTYPAVDDAYTTGKGNGGKGYGYGGKGSDYGGKGSDYGGKGSEYGGKGMGGMMMGGGMMSGGMMSGGKGGKGGKGGIYPIWDDYVFDDELPRGECQMIAFNETFAMPGPTAFLAPDTSAGDNGTPELPGTVFITEQVDLLELDGVTPIVGSTVTGTCTRTTIGANGGGVCQFVFIDDEGYSISVDGYLPGPLGGPLAITGGTGDMVGVFGQFDFFPIFSNTDVNATGDIFLDVIEYEVIADIGLVVCPY